MTAPGSIIPFVPGAPLTRHLPQQPVEPRVLDYESTAHPRPARPYGDCPPVRRRPNTSVDGKQALYRYRDEFFKFSGSSYRAVDGETIRAEIYSYLEGAHTKNADSYSPFKPKKGNVDNVIDALQAICNLDRAVETPAWLDGAGAKPPATEFLPVANGLLHLPTGKLHPASPLYFGSARPKSRTTRTHPNRTSGRNFSTRSFGDDLASIELAQDMLGYGLSPDTSQQKIMLLVGPPRSGKGTIAKVLTALVGASKVVGPTMASLGQNFGLAPLIGKNVAIIGDARIGGRTDQALITERLLSISGEDTHTIDRKFKEPWTGRLGTKFFVMTNELPRLTDNSGALANRFVVLMTQRSFLGQEDHELQSRLEREYPGILNWALQGY